MLFVGDNDAGNGASVQRKAFRIGIDRILRYIGRSVGFSHQTGERGLTAVDALCREIVVRRGGQHGNMIVLVPYDLARVLHGRAGRHASRQAQFHSRSFLRSSRIGRCVHVIFRAGCKCQQS